MGAVSDAAACACLAIYAAHIPPPYHHTARLHPKPRSENRQLQVQQDTWRNAHNKNHKTGGGLFTQHAVGGRLPQQTSIAFRHSKGM